MRARMAINIAGRDVRLREVLLRDKPDEMLSIAEQAETDVTVPLLVDGQNVLGESLDIMAWALVEHDPENWLSSKDDPLIAKNDGSFKHHLDRYKYSTRYEPSQKMRHRDEALGHLQSLEDRLEKAPFLSGQARSFVDVATFPFIRQFRGTDPDWFDETPYPHVQVWLKALTDTPLFAQIMVKFPTWKEAGTEVSFP